MTTINTNPYLATTDDSEKPAINSVPYLVKLTGGAGAGVTQGYYYNSQFYKDSAHAQVITPQAGQLFYDITSGSLYLYNGTVYSPVGVNTVGHFLSSWNCATGKPSTEPTTMPYTYHTGDYYLADNVTSGTKYKPNGTTYTGAASTTVESGSVQENDFYFFDGTVWILLKNTSKVNDVQVNGTSILSNGVANIPKSANSSLGVVMPNSPQGISVDNSGKLYLNTATNAQIEAKTDTYKPLTPATLNKAVMEGLGNNSLTWSSAYKTSARNTIGAVSLQPYDSTATPQDGILYYEVES